MCGIVGVLGPGREFVPALLQTLAHRGPDSQGWADLGSCGLGMTRLAILDPDERSNQPMSYGDATIVFNGEIYNYSQLRSELSRLGWKFDTTGDTEVLLKSILAWGPSALSRLRGMFAFLLWRGEQRELWAARDSAGIKPLYWSAPNANSLAFASETRCLTELLGAKVSSQAIADFLHFGSPYGNTAFEGITELEPGRLYVWHHDGTVSLSSFADAVTPTEAPLNRILKSAVQAHLVSDRRIALYLSGGFDSALVASQARDLNGDALTALTVDTGRNRRDVEGARSTARHYRLQHHILNCRDINIADRFLAYVGAMDQPTIDGFNAYLVSDMANTAGYPVALSGLGGDELFSGYGYYRRAHRLSFIGDLYRHAGDQGRRLLASSIARRVDRTPEQVDELLQARSATSRYLGWRSVFTAAEVRTLTGHYPSDISSLAPEQVVAAAKIFRSLDFNLYMRSTLLRDTDIFSMACGVEVRVPLLDLDLVATIQGMDASMTKAEAAQALDDQYLVALTRRPKDTFRLPWEDWLARGPLLDVLQHNDPWKGYIDPDRARIFLSADHCPSSRKVALLILAWWLNALSPPRRITPRPI